MRQPALPLLVALLFIASFSPVLSLQATDCKKGSFFKGAKCQKCRPGTYQDTDAATKCKKCPKGTFNLFKGAQGLDLCEPCKPNTFNNVFGANSPSFCKRCPKGTISVSGSDRCFTCPAGTSVRLPGGGIENYFRGYNFCDNTFPSRTPSRSCYAGNYPRKTKCLKCRPDTFSTKKNSFECERCGGGRFGDFAFLGATKCRGCPPGMFCKRGANVRPCLAWQFNDGTANCLRCPAGFQGNSQTGATSCVPCALGFFRSRVFSGKCSRCTGGKVVVRERTACITRMDDTACPSNFFKHAEGFCSRCNNAERLNMTAKKCEECLVNQASSGGLDTTCQSCPSGSSRELGQEKCTCNPGRIGVAGREVACMPCPPGTFAFGDRLCRPCPAGTFSSKAGTAECKKCGFNFVQPIEGQTKCERCSKGMVPNAIRGCVSPATNCPAGTERVVDEKNIGIACSPKTCPPGSFRSPRLAGSVEFAECVSCGFLFRYDPALNRCIRCPNDARFSLGGTSTDCFENMCKDGFTLDPATGECSCDFILVDGECRRCGPGTFTIGVGGGVECDPCPVGTFSSDRGFCDDCPLGTFSKMEGASACTPCPAGEVTLVTGSANCVVPGGIAS